MRFPAPAAGYLLLSFYGDWSNERRSGAAYIVFGLFYLDGGAPIFFGGACILEDCLAAGLLLTHSSSLEESFFLLSLAPDLPLLKFSCQYLTYFANFFGLFS